MRRRGDWSVLNPHLEPGGWFFEYRNGFYPDIDDTAMVLMALARTGAANTPAAPAGRRARPALAAGHAEPRRRLGGLRPRHQPRGADQGAVRRSQRHARSELSGHHRPRAGGARRITAIGVDHPQVRRALAFLRQTQEQSGCWLGRWGVNYLYGTWQVLVGLQKHRLRHGRPDGAPGRGVAARACSRPAAAGARSCRSYDDPALAGKGTPTASQTAWALLALMAAGEADSDAVARRHRLSAWPRRASDGDWHEEPFTGTGFPKVFYLKYHLYSLYFPLMALARYAEPPRREADGPRREARSHRADRRRLASPQETLDAFPPQPDDRHGRLHGPQEAVRRQALPAGADARAAARLQPHLHRLRPHPRVFDAPSRTS